MLKLSSALPAMVKKKKSKQINDEIRQASVQRLGKPVERAS